MLRYALRRPRRAGLILLLLLAVVLAGARSTAALAANALDGEEPIGLRRSAVLDSVAQAEMRVAVVGQAGGAARAVAVDGDLAVIAVGAQVVIADVSEPSVPREVYRSAVLRDVVADVELVDDIAYAVHGQQMLILDLSLPAQPTVLSHDWFHMLDDFHQIIVHNGFAYVLMEQLSPWGIWVIDVRDPSSPVVLTSQDNPEYGDGPFGWPRDIVAQGQFVYAAQSEGLVIVDVTDPTNPLRVGEFEVPNWVQAADVSGDYVYLATAGGDQGFERGLVIYNVAVPERPWFVVSNGTPCRGISVDGTYAYAALTSGGLSVVDVSNPHVPVDVRTEAFGDVDHIVADTGRVFVTESNKGVTTLHGSSAPPTDRASVLETWSPVIDTVAQLGGTLAYAAHGTGLAIVDVSTPTDPTALANLPLPHGAARLALDGAQVYVSSEESGISIVNATDPHDPLLVGAVATDGPAVALGAADRMLVVAEASRLRVVDAADPSSPRDVGAVTFDDWEPTDVVVADGIAYATDRRVGLRIFALSNAVPPAEVSRVEFRSAEFGYVHGMTLSGSHLYVTHGHDVMPTPFPRNPLDCPPPPPPRESRILEIDVSDPTAPRVAEDLAQAGWPRGLAVVKDFLFVPSGVARYYTKALLVRGLGPNTGFETEATLPSVPNGISTIGDGVVVAAGAAGLLVAELREADGAVTRPVYLPSVRHF